MNATVQCGFFPCAAPSLNRRARPQLGSAILREQSWNEIATALRLSGRELEIVRGVFDNAIEPTIAANLQISAHTVHTHMNRLFQKLSVTTRAELIIRVMAEFIALTSSPRSGLPPICRDRSLGRCPLNH